MYTGNKTTVYKRTSEDKNIPKCAIQQGKRLIESLNANRMIILNGLEDKSRNTFVSRYKGESTIDYIIVSHNFIEPAEGEREEEISEHRQKLVLETNSNNLELDFKDNIT